MGKFLKRVFNSLTVNCIIVAITIIAIFIFARFERSDELSIPKESEVMLSIILIFSFFCLNSVLIKLDGRIYQSKFTFVTFWAIFFFVVALTMLIFSLKSMNFKKKIWLFSYYSFIAFAYAVLVWSIYLNFCIRTLSSINVGCSVFVAITVKAILIAIVAWLALYKDLETDKSYIINFIASYISLCYPIIDMYKYVRLELDKYIEENAIK